MIPRAPAINPSATSPKLAQTPRFAQAGLPPDPDTKLFLKRRSSARAETTSHAGSGEESASNLNAQPKREVASIM